MKTRPTKRKDKFKIIMMMISHVLHTKINWISYSVIIVVVVVVVVVVVIWIKLK